MPKVTVAVALGSEVRALTLAMVRGVQCHLLATSKKVAGFCAMKGRQQERTTTTGREGSLPGLPCTTVRTER